MIVSDINYLLRLDIVTIYHYIGSVIYSIIDESGLNLTNLTNSFHLCVCTPY